jgi:hypothetical protein
VLVKLLDPQVLSPSGVSLVRRTVLDLPDEIAAALIAKRAAEPHVLEQPERAVGPRPRPKGGKSGNRSGKVYRGK